MSNINNLNNGAHTILIDGLPQYQVNPILDTESPFYYNNMKKDEYPTINKILKKLDEAKFNKIRSVIGLFSRDERLFALEFFDLLKTEEIKNNSKEIVDFTKNIRLKINFLKEIKDQDKRIKAIESIKNINQFNKNGDSLEINKEFINKLVEHEIDSEIIVNGYLNEIKDNLIETKEEELELSTEDKKEELGSLEEKLDSFIETKANNLTDYLDTNKDKGLEENLFNFINDTINKMQDIIINKLSTYLKYIKHRKN